MKKQTLRKIDAIKNGSLHNKEFKNIMDKYNFDNSEHEESESKEEKEKISLVVKYNQKLNCMVIEGSNGFEIMTEFDTRSTNGVFGDVDRFLNPKDTSSLINVLFGMEKFFDNLFDYVIAKKVIESLEKNQADAKVPIITEVEKLEWIEKETEVIQKQMTENVANKHSLSECFDVEIVEIQNIEQ